MTVSGAPPGRPFSLMIAGMPSITTPALSSLVRAQMSSPSPIRQIMKMAERQNILAMGLDPDEVISFGGGWVNHEAPEEFRQAYVEVAGDPALFHRSGGYTATLGELECRTQIARFEEALFGVPRLGPEHVAVGMGSTQLTHDLFRTVLDPGDTVLLLDPTYANYEGQLAFAAPGVRIVRLRVVDPETWSYLPDTDPDGVAREFGRLFDAHAPKLVLFGAPDNPTSQVVPQALAEVMRARTAEAGAWLAIDFAYKCQYFNPYPRTTRGRPPTTPASSASTRTRVGARPGAPARLDRGDAGGHRRPGARAAVQHPLPRHAGADDHGRYLERAIPAAPSAGVDETNDRYRAAARVTLDAIDRHIGRRRLVPAGGLYTVMDVGRDADAFVPEALKATGVLVVPGRGFGPSIANGVRISFGPLVNDTARLEAGLKRLGDWMNRA